MAQVTVYVPDKLWQEYQALRAESGEDKSTSLMVQEMLKRWIRRQQSAGIRHLVREQKEQTE